MTKKLLAIALLTCACAFADGDYVAIQKTVLAGAGTAFTIQQPASGGKTLRVRAMVIICDSTAKCDVTVERDGTAATATLGAAAGLTSLTPASKALMYTGSDVGAGAVSIPYTISAGGVLPLSDFRMALFGNSNVVSKNISIRVASMTGTITLQIYFSEN